MKYFKDTDNKVHAFELDGSQDRLIKETMAEITLEEVKILITPVLTTEQKEMNIRNQRMFLLSKTDWSQLPDVSQLVKDKWLSYRQSLRDITDQEGYPDSVIWPIAP